MSQVRDILGETTRKLAALLQRRKHYTREKAMLMACKVPPATRGMVFMRLLAKGHVVSTLSGGALAPTQTNGKGQRILERTT